MATMEQWRFGEITIDRVLELNVAVSDLTPDRTFVLLLDPETAAARAGSAPDRLEREEILVAAGHFEAPGFGRIVRLEGRRYWRGL